MALMTHIAEENIGELEDIIIEATQNKTERVKRFFFFYKVNRTLVVGQLQGTYCILIWVPKEEKGERKKLM